MLSARLRLRRGRHADAAAAGRQRPPAPVPACARTRAVINRFGFNNEGFDARAGAARARGPRGLVGVNVGANKDAADRDRRLCARRQDLRRRRRLSDDQRLLAQHAGPARPAARARRSTTLVARAVEARDESAPRRPLLVKIAPDLDDRELDDIVARRARAAASTASSSPTRRSRGRATLRSRHRGESGRPVGPAAVRALDAAARPRLPRARRRGAADRLRRRRGRRDRARQDRGRRRPRPALHRASRSRASASSPRSSTGSRARVDAAGRREPRGAERRPRAGVGAMRDRSCRRVRGAGDPRGERDVAAPIACPAPQIGVGARGACPRFLPPPASGAVPGQRARGDRRPADGTPKQMMKDSVTRPVSLRAALPPAVLSP